MRLLYRNRIVTSAIIANGQTISQPIDIRDFTRGSYKTPAALTGTTITFHVSVDGSTFSALSNETTDAAATSQTVAVNKQYSVPAAVFNYNFVKLVSGTAEGAARAIPVFLKA